MAFASAKPLRLFIFLNSSEDADAASNEYQLVVLCSTVVVFCFASSFLFCCFFSGEGYANIKLQVDSGRNTNAHIQHTATEPLTIRNKANKNANDPHDVQQQKQQHSLG